MAEEATPPAEHKEETKPIPKKELTKRQKRILVLIVVCLAGAGIASYYFFPEAWVGRGETLPPVTHSIADIENNYNEYLGQQVTVEGKLTMAGWLEYFALNDDNYHYVVLDNIPEDSRPTIYDMNHKYRVTGTVSYVPELLLGLVENKAAINVSKIWKIE